MRFTLRVRIADYFSAQSINGTFGLGNGDIKLLPFYAGSEMLSRSVHSRGGAFCGATVPLLGTKFFFLRASPFLANFCFFKQYSIIRTRP